MQKERDYAAELMYARHRRTSVFLEFPDNIKGQILLKMSKRVQKDIVEHLKESEILSLIRKMDPDEATDVLQLLPLRRRNRIVASLGQEIRQKVEFLLRFNPKTAAGIMSLDYIQIPKKTRFSVLSAMLRKHEKRTGKIPSVLVVENGFLVGEIPLHQLALSEKSADVGDYTRKIPVIRYDCDLKDVMRTFKKHPHSKIAVLNDDYSVMGIIYSDDILALIEKETSQSLYGFAGVSPEEDVLDPVFAKVRHRSTWLIINLMTAFLAALVVAIFQETISAFVLLAIYMPIIAGMGGNAGTQSMAVVVRGLALRETDLKHCRSVLINEVLAGAINGAIIGAIVAIVAILVNKNPMFGAIVAISMMVNLMIAGFFGALIPLIIKWLGKDPAVSASVFITTLTDTVGFFVFLSLASILLV